MGARNARVHVRARRHERSRARERSGRARRHERRQRDGQAHRVRRRAADRTGPTGRAGQGAERAGSRRARRRAAQSLADEGHGRRPEGRYEGARQQHVWARRGQHRTQRERPVLGARQHDLHIGARLAPASEERDVRNDPDAQPRTVGHRPGRRGTHLPQRE